MTLAPVDANRTSGSPAGAELREPGVNTRPRRNWVTQMWSTLQDYIKRVWDNSGEDNIFFLASGISFNLLLAIIPFILLFATTLTYILNESSEGAIREITLLLDRFLPPRADGGESIVVTTVRDAIAARGSVGLYAAIGFVWFSTRLFGSLRSVLCSIFDVEQDRGIVAGKIFDMGVTLVSAVLLVIYTALSAYLALATTRGVSALEVFGIREDVMGNLQYWIGRGLAFAFIVAAFWGIYKFLPNKKMRWQTALVASLFTGFAFELARSIFGAYASSFRPGSFYTGTLAAIVAVVIWVYYASIVFILGGEVAQVAELRRVRRVQQETFEE